MDGSLCTEEVSVEIIANKAMVEKQSFEFLRKEIQRFCRRQGWLYPEVVLLGHFIIVTYDASLSSGPCCERVLVLESYKSKLPNSSW